MKKYFIIFVLFFLPAFAFAQTFDYDLYFGMQNDSDITKLQEFLTDAGLYSGPISGNFFSLTLAGVKKFQAANSITPVSGYFGPKSRAKANEILASEGISNQEILTENGTTTAPQITPPKTTNDVVASLMEQIKLLQHQIAILSQQQSSIQAIQQQQASTSQQITQQTQTLQQIQQQTIPVSTSTTSISTPIQISSINITPSLTSVRIDWQTNIPAYSKIFLSGDTFLSKVYNSDSGLSTRHIVNATGLSGGHTYSYEIESIMNGQVAKQVGYLSTKPDEYTISVQADKTSVQASGWNSINFKLSALKNGQYQAQQSISMTTPDSTQNQTRPTNGITNATLNDWNTSFYYTPKTVGTHTLVFFWNGVSKGVDITAVPYVKIDPTVKDVVNSNCNPDCSTKPVFEINSTQEQSIGSFKFSQADESIIWDGSNINYGAGYVYESDIQDKGFFRIISAGEGYQLRVTPKTNAYALAPGIHTVTIKEIKATGQSSGLYRYILGLPITFTFEIKDIPNPEIIPIKTIHTYTLPIRGAPNAPGVVGSFKIKFNYNSTAKITSCRIRIEGNTFLEGQNIYTPSLHEENMQNESNICTGTISEGIKTDSIGVSISSYVLYVNLTPFAGSPDNYFKLTAGNAKFYVEDIKVTDRNTGITRSVSNPIVFDMEVIKL